MERSGDALSQKIEAIDRLPVGQTADRFSLEATALDARPQLSHQVIEMTDILFGRLEKEERQIGMGQEFPHSRRSAFESQPFDEHMPALAAQLADEQSNAVS